MLRYVGILIGAAFGLLFVLANAGDPIDSSLGSTFRSLAVVAFVAILVLAVFARRSGRARSRSRRDEWSKASPERDQFGRRFRIVVAAEVVVLFAGFQVIRLVDAPSQTGVAWVAVVVGVHFIALFWAWRRPSILVPGILLTIYGVVGLVVVSTDQAQWVPLISGVTSGSTLLACGLFFSGRELAGQRR